MQAKMLMWRSGESLGPNPLQLGRLKSRYEIKTTARERGAHGKERFIKNKRGWRRAMKNKTEGENLSGIRGGANWILCHICKGRPLLSA